MEALDIIASIETHGGTIRATPEGTIRVKWPIGGGLPVLRDEIRQRKPDLLALLTEIPRGQEELVELVGILEEARQPPPKPPPTPAPTIDPRHRRDVIGEQANPAAYVAWLLEPAALFLLPEAKPTNP